MTNFNYYGQYPHALDELNSQVTPEQFQYLLSVLSYSEDIPPMSSSTTVASVDSNVSQTSSWSNSHSDDSPPSSVDHVIKRPFDKPSMNGNKYDICTNPQFGRNKQSGEFTNNHLVLPLSKLSRRPSLFQLSSFDSTLTTANTPEENSSISRYGVTSKDSMVPLPRVSSSYEESMFENVKLVQKKYAEMPLPLVILQGENYEKDYCKPTAREIHNKSCSKLPVCKRIAGKFMARNERSRTSSVETVKAESLPDLDNPLVEIAGKIANEPINRFPILKTPHFKKPSRTTMTSGYQRLPHGDGFTRKATAPLDVNRIEHAIGRELDLFQDYKEVSEFFSRSKSCHSYRYPQNKGRKGIAYLSRSVTNPLYKAYDPAGYRKNEDELALECIQTVCDDLNKWTKSLVDRKKKESEKCNKPRQDDELEDDIEDKDEEQDDLSIIRPEFLINILRKELELPE